MTLDVEGVTERLSFVYEAIIQLKKELKVPLIGFAGSPFTLANYMIEGKGKNESKKTQEWIERDPVSFSYLLDLITHAVVQHVNGQIDAGVDCIQLFESSAHNLSKEHFLLYCLPYLQKVLNAIKPCPTIVFGLNTSVHVEQYAQLKPSAISFDARADLTSMQKKLPPAIAIQGNIDPVLLTGKKEDVEREVEKLLTQMKDCPRYIVNLGHGILPNTPEENVHALVNMVHGATVRC